MSLAAKEQGKRGLLVPVENAQEAAVVGGGEAEAEAGAVPPPALREQEELAEFWEQIDEMNDAEQAEAQAEKKKAAG